MPALRFAEEVGRRFGMERHFHEVERRCRALIAVSRQGHCLNSILHRFSTGTQRLRDLFERVDAELLVLARAEVEEG